jgi:class 3 adenylate cyclase/tetratricopeptide (TPR) repeat protein
MISGNDKSEDLGRGDETRQKENSSETGGGSRTEARTSSKSEIDSKPTLQPLAHLPLEDSTPKFLGDKILAHGDGEQSERRHVTVLVADVPDYSSISTKLDPIEGYKIMDGCLAIVAKQISHYGGTMTRVTGGVVKGLFGAPISQEDHAKRACEAALSILKLVSSYRRKIRKERDVDFEIRIGLVSVTILTRPVSIGTDLDFQDLDGVDDPIPTIDIIARPSKIVASKTTYELVSDFFEFQEMGRSDALAEGYELIRSREIVSPIQARGIRGLTKFVGRKQELSLLLEAAKKLRYGCGQVVAISGEAGVGKSRLALEFKNGLPKGQQTIFEGYCRSYDGVPSYHPLLDILKSIFGVRQGERESSVKRKIRQGLSRLMTDTEDVLAPLHEIFALKVSDEQYVRMSLNEKRHRIFQAIETILVGTSQEKILVVIIEDLHWIDRSSEEVLNYLIGRIQTAKILLVLLYRPEYAGISRLGNSVEEIHLDRISDHQVKELMESVLGGHEVEDDLLALVLDKTGRNPLFVEEFTRALSDDKAIVHRNGKCGLKKRLSRDLMPKTIRDVISARMDLLAQEAKITLQIASVIGYDFSVQVLTGIIGTRMDAQSHLSSLQQLEFIHEKPGFSGREFAFKHALTQEAAYDSLGVQERRRIHRKAGMALEELFSQRLEEFYEILAHHYSMSEDWDKAYRYLKFCVMKAKNLWSLNEAFIFCKEALAALNRLPGTVDNKRKQIEILFLADWIGMASFPREGLQPLLEDGERLAEEIGDKHSRARFQAGLCIHHQATGSPGEARKYFEKCFQDFSIIESAESIARDPELMVPFALESCLASFLRCKFPMARSIALKMAEVLEKTHRQFEFFELPFTPYIGFLNWGATSAAWLGDFDDGLALCSKALAEAQKTNHLFSLGWAELVYGWLLVFRGDGPATLEHLKDALVCFEKINPGNVWVSLVLFFSGYAHYLVGNFKIAQEHLERGCRLQIDSGLSDGIAMYYAVLGMVHADSGNYTEGQHCIEQALEWAPKYGTQEGEGMARIFAGRILGKSMSLRAEDAETSILQGIQILKDLGMKSWCAQGYLFLGELYLDIGRTKLGIKNLEKAERMFKTMKMDYWLRRTQEVFDRLQGSPL